MKRSAEDRQSFEDKAWNRRRYASESPEIYKNKNLNNKGRKKKNPKDYLEDSDIDPS